MPRRAAFVLLLACIGSGAQAQSKAGQPEGKGQGVTLSLDFDTRSIGSASQQRFGADGMDRNWQPGEEVSWQSGAVGLGLRNEGGKIKGGLFVRGGGWELGVRRVTNHSPMNTNGFKLRLTKRFGN